MKTTNTESRQGFLGLSSPLLFSNARITVVGAGGGGSHVIQQLLHLGFKRITVYDPDRIEHSNLNRLVGARIADADAGVLKVTAMERMSKDLCGNSYVIGIAKRWQEEPEALQQSDVVIGCIDGLLERQQLEAVCRKYLIPYVDIGLDVISAKNEAPQMAGQVILSMPGYACFKCMGFLTDEKLGGEALAYGDAGPRPQVVWPNGVLASTAVGIVVDLLTDWSKSTRRPLYLMYHGNNFELRSHPRMAFVQTDECSHFPLAELGPSRLTRL